MMYYNVCWFRTDTRAAPCKTHAAFGNWKLQWCPLRAADLTETDLTETDLTETDLTEADLMETDLMEADLTETDFTEAALL